MKNASVFDNSYSGFFVEHLKFQIDTPLMKCKHYHDFFEIYYYLGDKMNYFVGDKNYVLEKNNIVLIDKYVFHKTAYNSNDKNERVLIEFNYDVFNLILDKNLVNKIINLFHNIGKIELCNDTQKAYIHSIIFNLVSNYYSPSAYGLILAKLNLTELCINLIEIADSQNHCCSNDIVPSKPTEDNVVKIIKFINENYTSKITLDILADHYFVNKYYLCHIFKNKTGLSVINFVNSKRLFEAEKLLRYSNDRITEICYKVGFISINHFLKLFKNTYNLTPKKFRTDIQKHVRQK